jgi:hypothetical protein
MLAIAELINAPGKKSSTKLLIGATHFKEAIKSV